MQLNQNFSLNLTNLVGCTYDTNTYTSSCYLNLTTSTSNKAWRINPLPPGNYTANITVGKYSQDSKSITRNFTIV